MTTPCDMNKMTKVLWDNLNYSKVEFNAKEFTLTNKGHGIFVESIGRDILLDLRLSSERPCWGHSHPLQIQHNYGNLQNGPILDHYSVPKTEFTRMLETFQKVHFSEIIETEIEINYQTIVITFDESLLLHKMLTIKEKLNKIISNNPTIYFWIIEKDILPLSNKAIYVFQELFNQSDMKKHIHLCLDLHFISSVYIQSHHLFSDDQNVQLFLGLKKYIDNIITAKNGKNSKDFQLIDQFIEKFELSISRISRYLKFQTHLTPKELFNEGLCVSTDQPTDKTMILLPHACTSSELLDTLERIKNIIKMDI